MRLSMSFHTPSRFKPVTFLKLITPISPDNPPVRVERGKVAIPVPGTRIGGPDATSILGRMLRKHTVEVTFVPEFEVLGGASIVDWGANKKPVVTGEPLNTKYDVAPAVSLALVTALPSSLGAFEAAFDLFYASIPQIEITVLVVEYQTADALSFGLTGIDSTTPILANLTSNQLVRSYSSVFPAIDIRARHRLKSCHHAFHAKLPRI